MPMVSSAARVVPALVRSLSCWRPAVAATRGGVCSLLPKAGPAAVSMGPFAQARLLSSKAKGRAKVRGGRPARGLTALPQVDLETAPRIKLNDLRNVPGATRLKIRAGRGRAGRRGRKSGRGDKGTGQHGSSLPFWFQGGQSPLWQTSPKRGRPAGLKSVKYVPLNLTKLANAIKIGKLDPAHPINTYHLWTAGVITGSLKAIGVDCWGVKLLSTGAEDFDIPVTIEVQRASRSAIAAVEAAGGSIECKYYNKLGLRALLTPEKFKTGIPRLPMPKPKLRTWYENPDNRGVLPKPIAEQTPMAEQQ